MNLRWPALVVAAGLAAGLGYQLYLQRRHWYSRYTEEGFLKGI